MNRLAAFFVILVITTITCSRATMAAPDQYMGDTAIYSGESTSLRPKVLLVIDNSKATLNAARVNLFSWQR